MHLHLSSITCQMYILFSIKEHRCSQSSTCFARARRGAPSINTIFSPVNLLFDSIDRYRFSTRIWSIALVRVMLVTDHFAVFKQSKPNGIIFLFPTTGDGDSRGYADMFVSRFPIRAATMHTSRTLSLASKHQLWILSQFNRLASTKWVFMFDLRPKTTDSSF